MRSSFWRQLGVLLASGCLLAGSAGTLRADEVLRKVQQSLRDQGFYYGTIDGSPGDETTQAIRRYQIRNGLAVSGELNDETRKAIEKTGASSPRSAASSSVKPSDTAREDRQYAESTPPPLAREQPAPVSRPAPASRPAPVQAEPDVQPAAVQTTRPDLRVPPRGAVAASPELSIYFTDTPYEFAPPPIQADVLRRAQSRLLHDGFYDGAADGVPSPATAEALSNFQEVNHIKRTGALDTATLSYLRLLPHRQRNAEVYSAPRRPGAIYEGRIVR